LPTNSLEIGFYAVISDWPEYRRINNDIEELGKTAHGSPRISELLEFLTKMKGKRTRPIIALLSARLSGGSHDDVMNFALAIELIHAASLVHDDVIDKGRIRRNVETLNVRYGIPVAILMGDWLISKSVELVSIYDEQVIRDFARLGMTMVKGEVMDIHSIDETASVEDYFECIAAKTAKIFAYAAENACKIVSDDEAAARSLFDYGKNLGTAYQLVDDLLEYWEIYDDKKSELESRTLPVIYEATYGFDESASKILELIQKHISISKKAIEYFEPCDSREKLHRMIDYMTTGMLRSYASKNKGFLTMLDSFYQVHTK
jgi:octaprenyl-diphosphate synthase